MALIILCLLRSTGYIFLLFSFLSGTTVPLESASLHEEKSPQKEHFSSSPFIFLIHCHKTIISPSDGPRSHFRPSSSSYMLQSITEWGVLQGVALGLERLQRENADPWVYDLYLDKEGLFKHDDPPQKIRIDLESRKEIKAKDDLLMRILKKKVKIAGKVP